MRGHFYFHFTNPGSPPTARNLASRNTRTLSPAISPRYIFLTSIGPLLAKVIRNQVKDGASAGTAVFDERAAAQQHLPPAAQGLVSKGAAKKVSRWLQRATLQEQEAFRQLAAAIRLRAGLGPADHAEKPARSRDRDSHERVYVTVVPPSPGPPPGAPSLGHNRHSGGADEALSLRQRFPAQYDSALLPGGRSVKEVLGSGELGMVRRALQERLNARAGSLREAWRKADPGMQGYLDTDGLAALLKEHGIPVPAPAARAALLEALDADGDGLVSFGDFCTGLGDLALEERDFFAVSRRPGAMLANEPVIFEMPEHSGAGQAAERAPSAEGGSWSLPVNSPDSAAEGPETAAGLQEGCSSGPQAAQARFTGRPTIDFGAVRAASGSRTSNFRTVSPKPLRSAAFMPTRQPMRRTTAALVAAPSGPGQEVVAARSAKSPTTFDVLVLDDRGPPGPGRSVRFPHGPTRAIKEPGLSFEGDSHHHASMALRAATPSAPMADRRPPADIFLMRPRTSMALHKEPVLLERAGASSTWD